MKHIFGSLDLYLLYYLYIHSKHLINNIKNNQSHLFRPNLKQQNLSHIKIKGIQLNLLKIFTFEQKTFYEPIF